MPDFRKFPKSGLRIFPFPIRSPRRRQVVLAYGVAPMDRPRPITNLRSGAILAAAVLLAAAGGTGCGVAKPSPAAPREQVAASTPKDPTHLVLRLGERRIYLMDGTPST